MKFPVAVLENAPFSAISLYCTTKIARSPPELAGKTH